MKTGFAECRVRPDGTKVWYEHNVLHRTDGPAVEYTNGTKVWYRYGRCHRFDGPAIERNNGNREWWYDGRYIKSCISKAVAYIRNKGTENEEEMEIELCCKECAKLYYNMSEEEFDKIKGINN